MCVCDRENQSTCFFLFFVEHKEPDSGPKQPQMQKFEKCGSMISDCPGYLGTNLKTRFCIEIF